MSYDKILVETIWNFPNVLEITVPFGYKISFFSTHH